MDNAHKCTARIHICAFTRQYASAHVKTFQYSFVQVIYSSVGLKSRVRTRGHLGAKAESLRLQRRRSKDSSTCLLLQVVAMPFTPSSFLFLVVRPGAPSSVLAPIQFVSNSPFFLSVCPSFDERHLKETKRDTEDELKWDE